MGDGNINYVYIVEGPQGALVVKQGLPYIRIDHSWKLTQVTLLFIAWSICFTSAFQSHQSHAFPIVNFMYKKATDERGRWGGEGGRALHPLF